MSRVEHIGDATLYLGDCREILPILGPVDAVVTDPPYGIGKDGQKRTTGGNGGRKAYDFMGWDGERPDAALLVALHRMSPICVMWGGNYFADLLPPAGKWLVWDKGQRNFSLADCEFAWSSQQLAARVLTLPRGEALQDGKEHPTQKPVRLMAWCLDMHPKAKTVCDPFMGTGTTGVACVQSGRRFIGIERERNYFEIACRRIEQAAAQGQLLPADPAGEPQQTGLALEP
mgnify:CR=1 FL=1